ncbi:hypothetical protein HMPREF9093_01614 [Fusobacterium sp. oral taxon 370 str. F0437]|nr:hypothetical protein HMPREF9093_01614 [Fusobacterium sp. oral taxon 370 str. F0437]
MKIAQELRAGSTIKIGNDPFVVLKAEYNQIRKKCCRC